LGLLGAGKRPQVSNQSVDLSCGKGVERWHSGARNAVLDHSKNLGVGHAPDIRGIDNIRRTLTAFSVDAMTRRATGSKELFAAARGRFDLLLRPHCL
jgi:hypothetical protein